MVKTQMTFSTRNIAISGDWRQMEKSMQKFMLANFCIERLQTTSIGSDKGVTLLDASVRKGMIYAAGGVSPTSKSVLRRGSARETSI